MCGLSCTDSGKVSKTVPYEKITDCDVSEPAGTACCCFIPNVLTKVVVETASSSKETPDLVLEGLEDAHAFKHAVWAMKRFNGGQASAPSGAGASGQQMPAGELRTTNLLLTEIRDELRVMNQSLKAGR
ncbi:unnamed protein product [Symbiodinium pilosum]|uniref:Uncharacterized protein n=1 Tax=Symbiodinium pilosum TaxID=2952 RepID=A0A812K501_SYMPI|nr:unnamed protein product [Symbiodinium pilosum]